MKVFRQAILPAGMVGVLLLGLSGCASSGDPSRSSPAAGLDGESGGAMGKVLFVNRDLQYVIVQGRNLPTNPEKAKVYRDAFEVGTVQFDGSPQPPFAAADIETGEIKVGDRVMR